jgi:hypothetical protein
MCKDAADALKALGAAAIAEAARIAREAARIKREADEFADAMKRAAREFREGEPLHGEGA